MARNNEGNPINPGYFGHGVIGETLHEAEQAVVEKSGDVFGPGVTGLPTGKVNEPGPGVLGQGPMLSLEALEKALAASPLLVDTFLKPELARPEGPRKGALAALEAAERKRPGGPRADVIAQIEAAFFAELEKKGGAKD